MKRDRLFVPLNKHWYDLFANGKKKWEIRGVGPLFNPGTVSYPSPEGEGLSAALSRSVPKSEICPSLQASLHAPTNRRGPRLAGTLASDLPETTSNRISAVPFRARVWQSRTGSASNGLPGGCLRCPSTYRRWI